jgi:hypothetical protein
MSMIFLRYRREAVRTVTFALSCVRAVSLYDTGSFAEALAADEQHSLVMCCIVGAQSDLLQKNNYWRLNASLRVC